MLSPKTLSFSGIGRFVDKQTIEFDSMGQLVQIDGENNNTGGSSGSGKTTVFNALEYNLGLNDIPDKVLQSRLTKDGIHTEAVYDWDGKEVIIIRGKGKFSVSVDGSEIDGSAKLGEEKINEIIGMSRDLFRPIFHKRQKEGGFFLKFKPSETHQFLTDILNLGKYSKDIEKVDKQLKDFAEFKEKTLSDVNANRMASKATFDAIMVLGLAPIQDMHQSVVDKLKAKLDTSMASLEALQVAHKIQKGIVESQRPVQVQAISLPTPILDKTPYNTSTLDIAISAKTYSESKIGELNEKERNRQASIQKLIQEVKVNCSTLTYKVALATTAKQEAQKIASEIKSIRDCVCPMCLQSWVVEASKVKENELLTKLSAYRLQIEQGNAAEQDILAANAYILDLQSQLTAYIDPELDILKQEIANQSAIIVEEGSKSVIHLNNQNAENERKMSAYRTDNEKAQREIHSKNAQSNDEFALKQQALAHQQTIELDQARGQADVDRRAYDTATNKLKNYEEASLKYIAQHSQLKTQETLYYQKLEDMDQKLVIMEAKIAIAEETKRAIKSFMSCSFDEALDEIGDAATNIIRAIPNMANATIQFQGIRETGSGKIKEEVNAVISMDGEEGIDIRSLSGGERSSADLAIDLAVIDLIENRSNKGISVFILDEPFTGLDTVSIEMVLELLKNVKMNKKLILVDHNPIICEFMSQRIIVERTGSTSTLKYENM